MATQRFPEPQVCEERVTAQKSVLEVQKTPSGLAALASSVQVELTCVLVVCTLSGFDELTVMHTGAMKVVELVGELVAVSDGPVVALEQSLAVEKERSILQVTHGAQVQPLQVVGTSRFWL